MEEKEVCYHVPVMLHESLEGLDIQPSGVYVDVTFGGGGHSREILNRLNDEGELYGFDQDADAEKNIPADSRFVFVRSNFRYLYNFMRYHGVAGEVDGLLADLGVSSHHFDDKDRGFSFRFDGALDMRMNTRAGQTAADIVNTYTEEQLARYKKEIDDKIRLHRRHHTDLVYTYSEYDDGRDYLDHLQEMLVAQGIEFRPRTSREVFDKLVSTEENKYIIKLVKLVCTFLHGFKTNGFTIEHFHQFQSKSSNERNKLFLSICERCYLEYSKRLKEKQAVDFEDMINSSAKMLREKEIQGERLGFKYIIVDEYQDISRQRFNLTLELSKLCDAKIVAVGDDWQSIYAYAGSDITLFTQFKDSFGYGLELGITQTYRNAQEVIDIAGSFIQKNTAQIRKSLVSPKHITRPIVVETYTENVDRSKYAGRGGKYFLVGETVERIVGQILEENPDASILLLGRYGFDAFNLCRSSEFTYEEKTGNVISKKYPFAKLDFMTVHRAKGLGYDHVILINARNELYGFPSQVQDDPVLKYVVRDDHSMEYAEERRLFYVALTRTKNRVYIVTPQQHPSDFVRELVKDYPGVMVNGKLDDCRETRTEMKRCPVCGYPMQLRYKKAYGLKLWICSNEPEICDFMTNNLKGGDLPILKCDCCKDGYLIVKEGWGEPFLGCTNFRADRSGCNRAISRDKYLRSVKPLFDE